MHLNENPFSTDLIEHVKGISQIKTLNLLNKARTLVALGIHQVHLDIGGKSCGLGGKSLQAMKL